MNEVCTWYPGPYRSGSTQRMHPHNLVWHGLRWNLLVDQFLMEKRNPSEKPCLNQYNLHTFAIFCQISHHHYICHLGQIFFFSYEARLEKFLKFLFYYSLPFSSKVMLFLPNGPHFCNHVQLMCNFFEINVRHIYWHSHKIINILSQKINQAILQVEW